MMGHGAAVAADRRHTVTVDTEITHHAELYSSQRFRETVCADVNIDSLGFELTSGTTWAAAPAACTQSPRRGR